MVQAAGRILEIGGGTDIPGDAGMTACGRIVEHGNRSRAKIRQKSKK